MSRTTLLIKRQTTTAAKPAHRDHIRNSRFREILQPPCGEAHAGALHLQSMQTIAFCRFSSWVPTLLIARN